MAPSSASSIGKFRRLALCLLLAIATLGIYAQVVGHDFTLYDDRDYVSENSHVRGGLGLAGLRWAFTTSHASNWHPLTWLSHMLDCQIFGLKAGPPLLINVLLHVASTLLLFLVLERMTAAPWKSGFVAALFALHPLHVESVAWLSERKDVLSGLFWMLTIGSYVLWVERPSRWGFARTMLLFGLGLLAKPMLVTLPFVLLLLDYWPLKRFVGEHISGAPRPRSTASRPMGAPPAPSSPVQASLRSNSENATASGRARTRSRSGYETVRDTTLIPLIVEKIPLMVLALASSVVTFLVQNAGGAVVAAGKLPFGTRLVNALVSYVRYTGKMFWPTDLAIFYPYPAGWPAWTVAGAALLLAAVTAIALRYARTLPFLLVGWFWYLGTLVPVIGLVQVGSQAMADRYTYIPMIGLFIAVAWGTGALVISRPFGGEIRRAHGAVDHGLGGPAPKRRETPTAGAALAASQLGRRPAIVLTIVAVAVLAALSVLTYRQIGYWRNSDTLFAHAAEVTTGNFLAHRMLGMTSERAGRLEEAARHYDESFRLRPHTESANSLGVVLAKMGSLDDATARFKDALRLDPSNAEATANLGDALARRGRIDEAMARYAEALRLDPKSAKVHNSFGACLASLGRTAEAIAQYETAIFLDPLGAQFQNNLAVSLVAAKRTKEAIAAYREAIRLDPGYADAHYNLGAALLNEGRRDEASREFRETLRLTPGHPAAVAALRLAAGR